MINPEISIMVFVSNSTKYIQQTLTIMDQYKKIFLAFLFCFSPYGFCNAQKLDSAQWFDFWIGEWEATWQEAGNQIGKGENTITTILDGKVIQEEFRILEGSSKGFKGNSLSVFNPTKNTWNQAWADNQGGYFSFSGLLEDDNRIFITPPKEVNGKEVIQRMVFRNIQPNNFTWDWESSYDGGKTWKLLWQIQYQRKL